jgi:Formyltetrahydrofolate synthetase
MTVPSDIEIAHASKLLPIGEIAAKAGIPEEALIPYGKTKAKVDLNFMKALEDRPDGKLVLVTATTPTPAGEGKTTTTIGLTQALAKMGHSAMICLREPSLGPCFGVKGGGRRRGATPRCCPWRTSTCTSRGTSTRSPRPTTCCRRCWTTTCSRVTTWGSTRGRSCSGGSWT